MSNPKLPTREEIAELPRWARVAFAARCARRLLFRYSGQHPDSSSWYLSVVTRAVDLAEMYAIKRVVMVGGATSARTIAADARAAAVGDTVDDGARAAANAAADAAYAAADAADHFGYVAGVADAARAVANAAQSGTIEAIHKDFLLVRNRARVEEWTEDTPVPPDVFGPLWPDGPPPGWPVETSEGEEIVIEIEVPFGTTTEVAAAFVKNLLTQADDLDRALGGNGLMVESVDVYGDDSAAGRGRVAS